MNALKLVQVDFDNYENKLSAAISEKVLGVFVDEKPDSTVVFQGVVIFEGGETARSKLIGYMQDLPKPQFYLGWDNQVYPKFLVKETRVNPKPECA